MAEILKEVLRILRHKQVTVATGLSRSTIYARLNPKSPHYDPTFPKPIELGNGMQKPPVGWVESEVDAWLTAQIEKRRQAETAAGLGANDCDTAPKINSGKRNPKPKQKPRQGGDPIADILTTHDLGG